MTAKMKFEGGGEVEFHSDSFEQSLMVAIQSVPDNEVGVIWVHHVNCAAREGDLSTCDCDVRAVVVDMRAGNTLSQ